MRIVVTNPDSIGDFVLRQPLYQALASAGHDLFLIVRSAVIPLAAQVAPGAIVAELTLNPYDAAFDVSGAEVQRLVDEARSFRPDVVCIAPYQRTTLDERLAEALRPCYTVGMQGVLYDPRSQSVTASGATLQLDRSVAVSEDARELEKNQRLCGVLLGRAVELPKPRITATSEQDDLARTALQRLGVRPGDYWVGCVGHSPYGAVRNWGAANWAGALSHAASRYGRRFLLIGSADEQVVTEEIRQRMADAATGCVNLCGTTPGLDLALGLIQNSAGYIGRDTGPMHIAAAMDKPVIAVFGGGNWPRFIPAAKTGVVLTVPLPCSPCGWMCHLPDSYCVKQIPAGAVLNAIDEVEAGSVQGLVVRQIAPDDALIARVVREGAAAARALRKSAEVDRSAFVRKLSETEGELRENRQKFSEAEREFRQKLSETEGELRSRVEHYEALREVMRGMAHETEMLSAQLGSARRAQEQVDRECTALRHSIETSLALRLVRSVRWVADPLRRAVLRLGARANRSGIVS